MSLFTFMGALEQGLAYSLVALGVFLSFKVLNFPDLTVDGSFPLGAAVSASLILAGLDPYLSLVVAFGAGFAAGLVTGVLGTKLRILHLLAGIITMTALYSINIRIMGRPNLALLNQPSVFTFLQGRGLPEHFLLPLYFFGVAVLVTAFLVVFLNTELGLGLRATGDNPQMITSQGGNTTGYILLGLGLSNALVALAGALVAQSQGSADVNMGVGMIIAGLASVIIGSTVFPDRNVFLAATGVVAGSVLYRLAIAVALSVRVGGLSLTPSDLNLITAILVVAAVGLPVFRRKLGLKVFRP